MTDNRDRLAELLADAVAEPPVTSVTAADTYRRGRRRRTATRAGTACAVVAVLALSGLAATQLRPGPDGDGPLVALDPLPATPTRCADLAEAVKSVAAATLPTEVEWTGTRLPEGADDCTGGGLFWVSFRFEGGEHTLGFEGGTSAEGKPCDPERKVVRCDKDGGGYEIGHYRATDDYGVLLGGDNLFFFLGLDDGVDPPLTTDQLALVAKEIARVVYRE
jgi:hypothetical protein